MAVYALCEARELAARRARAARSPRVLGLAQFCLNFNFVYRAEQHITSGLVAVVFALLLVPNAVFGAHLPRPEARAAAGDRIGGRDGGDRRCCSCTRRGSIRTGRGRCWPASASRCARVLSASTANVMQATPTAARYPMVPMLAVAMLIGAALDAVVRAGHRRAAGDRDARGLFGRHPLSRRRSPRRSPSRSISACSATIGPAKAAYSSVIVPVIAMLLSTLFEGYRWSALAVAGAALAGGRAGHRAEGAQAQPVVGVARRASRARASPCRSRRGGSRHGKRAPSATASSSGTNGGGSMPEQRAGELDHVVLRRGQIVGEIVRARRRVEPGDHAARR